MASPHPSDPPPPLRKEQLHSVLSPHPDPLATVAYGYMDPASGLPRVDRKSVPSPNIVSSLSHALKLAEAVILHPHSLTANIAIFAPKSSTKHLVVQGIRAALHDMRLNIYLDRTLAEGGSIGVFGKHGRPPITEYSDIIAHAIFLNPWFVDRLVQAQQDSVQHPANSHDYERHVFITAMGIAHELVHLLRCQLYYRLRECPIEIQYDTPPKALACGDSNDGEAGWEFEDRILDGMLRGGWASDTCDTPSPPSSDHPEFASKIGDILAAQNRMPPDGGERHLSKNKPFDYALLCRTSDGHERHFKINDKWINELVSDFKQKGSVKNISFPPSVAPEPLFWWEYTRVSMRRIKERDIIRSYELFPPESPSPQKNSAPRAAGRTHMLPIDKE